MRGSRELGWKRSLTPAAGAIVVMLSVASTAWACSTLSKAYLTASPPQAPSGSRVSVGGHQMTAMHSTPTTRIVWLDNANQYLSDLATVDAANDTFTVEVTIPQSAPGNYYIGAYNGSYRATPATFEVVKGSAGSSPPAPASAPSGTTTSSAPLSSSAPAKPSSGDVPAPVMPQANTAAAPSLPKGNVTTGAPTSSVAAPNAVQASSPTSSATATAAGADGPLALVPNVDNRNSSSPSASATDSRLAATTKQAPAEPGKVPLVLIGAVPVGVLAAAAGGVLTTLRWRQRRRLPPLNSA
jgi:hypothetical protein